MSRESRHIMRNLSAIVLSMLLICMTAYSQDKKKAEAKPAAAPKVDKPAPKPADKPAPKPAEKPAPKPAEKPAPKPAEKPAPKPEAKPAAKEEPQGQPQPPGKDYGTNIQMRIVGSVIFPERGNIVRESSALKVVTPEVRTLIKKALQYVKSSQQADGSWGDKQFPKSSGVTALCCMSLLAEGSLPRVGYSGKELDNGISFLLSCAKEDGLIVAKNTYEYGPMYDHTWATFVLLEAYGNCPWYPELRQKLSRAIQALLKAQKPDGGWRYTTSPLGSSDVSVTASALTTMRLARMAGFAVPETNVDRAQKFLERCGVPTRPEEEGTFCYREFGERGSPSTAAAGLLGLFSRGLYKHKFVKPTVERIAEPYRRAHVDELTDNRQFRYYYFGCYYVSQVLYQAGDEYWLPWYKKYAEALKMYQADNGALRDASGNTVYPTAMSALILQAPLGYMPQYLR